MSLSFQLEWKRFIIPAFSCLVWALFSQASSAQQTEKPAAKATKDTQLEISCDVPCVLVAPDGRETGYAANRDEIHEFNGIPDSAHFSDEVAADDSSGDTTGPDFTIDVNGPIQG